MPRAAVNGVTLAESDHTEVVEGNHYFPPESVEPEIFRVSSTRTQCPWKYDTSHYTLEAGGERVDGAAWYYPEPRDAAGNIKDDGPFYGNKVRIEG